MLFFYIQFGSQCCGSILKAQVLPCNYLKWPIIVQNKLWTRLFVGSCKSGNVGLHVTSVMRLELLLELNLPNKLYYCDDEIKLIFLWLEGPPSAPVQGMRASAAGVKWGRESVCVIWDSLGEQQECQQPSGSQRTFNCSAQHTHFHLMDLNISNLSRHSLLTFLSSLYPLLSGDRGREKGKKGKGRSGVPLASSRANLNWHDIKV